MYDETTGVIMTPEGWGKYVGFNPATGKVTVEMEHSHFVEFAGKDCYLK